MLNGPVLLISHKFIEHLGINEITDVALMVAYPLTLITHQLKLGIIKHSMHYLGFILYSLQ